MKSLFKDMWRELLKSKSRFISIFLIIALGTGFFAGVKVSSGDMINTVRKYYNSTNLADVKLISTLGFTDNDIDEIKNTGANVNAGYFLDVILNNLDNKLVVRTMSFDIENYADENYINKPVLVEGSFPQNKNEILIDSYACPSDIKIGSKIKFEEQVGENSVLDTLDSLEYTVVGKVNSSSYISKQRGTTTVGSGQIDLFAYIPKEKYITDVFTEVYVTYDDLRDTKAYTKKYDNGIKEKVDKLKQIGNIQSKKRYDEIYSDANYEIIKAKGNILAEETSAKQKLDKAKAELDAAKLEVEENQQKIDYAAAMGMDVSQMQAQLEEAKQQIKTGEKEYNDGLSELNSKINEAKLEIDKAEIKLNDLQKGEWFVLDRTYNTAYDSFKTDADRVDAIAKVFPVFFIVVAILVCLTTMTRMVEDNRTQVGVLKALGVSNGLISFKYISYALVSSLLGSVVGLAFGFKVLPILIYNAYKSMYQLPKLIAPFKWDYFIIITISAILCTVLTAKFIISSELKEQPSQLMRPKAPKAGKRIFLEKMNFIWKRFSFLQKITARNIFRNKQRMLMTIIGIAGCTALMLAGFGLYDAISVIGDRQYKDIFKYDTLVAFKDDFSAENSDDFISFTQGEKSVEKAVMVLQEEVEFTVSDDTKKTYLVVPTDEIEEIISLKNPKTKEKISLDNSGAIITQKLAKMLKLKAEDSIKINFEDKEYNIKVSGITENYTYNYIYLTKEYYKEIFNQDVKINNALIKFTDDLQREEFLEEAVKKDYIAATVKVSDIAKTFDDVVNSLISIVIVIIISSGTLAFVVLYSLTEINVSERIRELATLKVLGFYDKELSSYIFRENIVFAVAGIALGLFGGVFLTKFVIATAETDIVMFNPVIGWYCFLCAGLLSFIFTLIVNWTFYFKLKKIDMVESLKSVE